MFKHELKQKIATEFLFLSLVLNSKYTQAM